MSNPNNKKKRSSVGIRCSSLNNLKELEKKLGSKISVLAPVVQKLDSTIHRINLYPVDNAIGFPDTYPLDSDLSGG